MIAAHDRLAGVFAQARAEKRAALIIYLIFTIIRPEKF